MIAKEKAEIAGAKISRASCVRSLKTIKNHVFIHCIQPNSGPSFSLRHFLEVCFGGQSNERTIRNLHRIYPVIATCRISEIEKGLIQFTQEIPKLLKVAQKSSKFVWYLQHEVKNSDFVKIDSIVLPVKRIMWDIFTDSDSGSDSFDHLIKLIIIKQFCYFSVMTDYSKNSKYIFSM